jgi:hypothetical protein
MDTNTATMIIGLAALICLTVVIVARYYFNSKD